jgi:hypothetical protein
MDVFEAAVVELAEETYNKKQLASYTTPIKTDKKDGTVYIEAHTYEIPMVADAKGKPVKNPEDLRIGGGTIGRLKITLSADPNANKPYVTAYLNGVQVVKLVEYGAGGFGDASDELEDNEDAFDAASVPERERSSRDDNDEDNSEEDDDSDGGSPKSATDF